MNRIATKKVGAASPSIAQPRRTTSNQVSRLMAARMPMGMAIELTTSAVKKASWERNRELPPPLIRNRAAQQIGVAQVSSNNSPCPVQILDHNGTIQTQLLAEILQLFQRVGSLTGRPTQDDGGNVAGDYTQDNKDGNGNPNQRWNKKKDSSNDVLTHIPPNNLWPPLLAAIDYHIR